MLFTSMCIKQGRFGSFFHKIIIQVFEMYYLIHFFMLRKLSWNWGNFSSTALVPDTYYANRLHRLAQYQKIYLNFRIILLIKYKKLYYYISFWCHYQILSQKKDFYFHEMIYFLTNKEMRNFSTTYWKT